MKKISSVLSLVLSMNPLAAENLLSPGASAPDDLQVVLDDGTQLDLGQRLQSGWSLLFFYPRAMTPGCTRQACSIRDEFEWMVENQVNVFGVSQDSVERQARFREKEGLPYPLIADTDQQTHHAFGVRPMQRVAFLVKDGTVVWVDKGSTTDQASKAMEAFKGLREKK